MNYRSIQIGDFVERLTQYTSFGPDFHLDLLAGRHVVMLFAGTLQSPIALQALDRLKQLAIFNGEDAVLLVVLGGTADKPSASSHLNSKGVGVVYDHDLKVSRAFGAAPVEADAKGDIKYRQIVCVLNPRMQVDRVFGLENVEQAADYVEGLGEVGAFLGFEVFAPILLIPNVFEAPLRALLIEQFKEHAREGAGGHRNIRRECPIEDQGLLEIITRRIRTRVRPELKKIHQFEVTRIERSLIACSRAEDDGDFRSRRDNTSPTTAHRKFALSVNLNDDFDGGEICFPEYGPRTYRAPAGGAVVFSCALLHAVTPVTRGARCAYLAFLNDAEGSRMRAANVGPYAGASFAAAPAKQDADLREPV